MPLLKEEDTVIINETSFTKFMDYRREKNLSIEWGWMQLPAGSMLEVKGLIFRTTGRWKSKKKIDENGEEYKKRSKGRSCWVKCSVVSPINRIGEEHTIPSWILKRTVISHVSASENDS